MMNICWNTVAMLILAPTIAAAQRAAPIPVDTAAMDAHLRFLASDLLEGRAPATRGGRLAGEYVAAQFQALGLEPAGANGTYFQPVALVGMTPEPTLSWGKAGGAADTLVYRDAFVAWGERPEADIAASGDVVFVGYGIRAPEWQWDDYKGADLHGKVLLMLVNDPGLVDSTVFLGKILTYYGRWTYKLEEAARQGAAGAILIHTTESATYPWEVVRGSWSVEQFKLDQPQSPSLAFAGWVTESSARETLTKVGLNLDSLTRAAARRDFHPVATGLTATVRIHSALRRVESENVTARLGGRDPRLASQAVLLTAHWDHKGIGPAIRGDSIYNGAEDNASGVAALLGAAARVESLKVESEPDVRGSFFRSDHFPFARAGVPALSIYAGDDFAGRAKGWGEEQESIYNQQRYHQPSDEYQTTFRYAGMAQEVRVTVRTARAIADAPTLPHWLPTSEFQRPQP